MDTKSDKVRTIVIVTIGILAFIGVTSLCLTLFYKNYADPSVLTAIISTTSTLIGALANMAVNKSSSQTQQKQTNENQPEPTP